MSKQIKISNLEVEQVEGDNTKLLFWFNDSSLILIKGVAGALYATFEDDSEENFIFDWVLDERENAPDYYNHLSRSEKIILGIDYALEQKELKKFHGLFNKYW